MNDPTSLGGVFTSTSAIRNIVTANIGRRQIRVHNAGKQKPYLHVGDSLLWCPARKLRRLLSPLFGVIKSALRVFTSPNGSYKAFTLSCLSLIQGDYVHFSSHQKFWVSLPSIPGLNIRTLVISDDGAELGLIAAGYVFHLYSIYSDRWETIAPPIQQGKLGMYVHWAPECLTIYYATVAKDSEDELFLSVFSRTRGLHHNITTVWNWKTAISFGFFLMHSVEDISEGDLDLMLDFHPNTKTLAIFASGFNSSFLALIHLSANPGGYLLPLMQLMHRKTHISSSRSDDYNQGMACMTWLFSMQMPVLVLMSKVGHVLCVTPGGRVWFAKNMPMINPLERVNKVLPILDPAFSLSTDAGRGEYCIASGVDLDNRHWLLATDGHILSSCCIEPEFSAFSFPKQHGLMHCQVSEWHDTLAFGQSIDTVSYLLLGSLPEPLNHVLEWMDMIMLPCQGTHLFLGLDMMEKILSQLLISIPAREFFAIHVIQHTEKWLSLIFGEPFTWANGWQSLACTLSQRAQPLNCALEALYENALLNGPQTSSSTEPVEDLQDICQYIQGANPVNLFQSPYRRFLASLHRNLQFAYELVISTFNNGFESSATDEAIRRAWIQFGIQVIHSREYQWTIPIYTSSLFDGDQDMEVDILFLQEAHALSPEIFSPEMLFSVAARNEDHALQLLSASKSWFFCWTTRFIVALTAGDATETPSTLEDILVTMLAENNVKALLCIGKVTQASRLVLPSPYTEALLEKLTQLIRSHLKPVPVGEGEYPGIQFLLTQSILEPNFSESSFFVMALDWILCAIYFAYHQPLLTQVTRILYAFHLRKGLIENEAHSIAYLESALALAHYNDLFPEQELVDLAKSTLQRYPQHQWLDIMQATAFDLSPTLVVSLLGSHGYPSHPLSFNTHLSEDPRFRAFHEEICQIIDENIVSTGSVPSLYDIMLAHWHPEFPPLLPREAWTALCEQKEGVAPTPSPSFPPVSVESCIVHSTVSNDTVRVPMIEELASDEEKVPVPAPDPLPQAETCASLAEEEAITEPPPPQSVSMPNIAEPAPASFRTSDTTLKNSDGMNGSNPFLSSLSATFEKLHKDLKELTLQEKSVPHPTNVKKKSKASKKSSAAQTSQKTAGMTRSPSFENYLKERIWKKTESELFSQPKALPKKPQSFSDKSDILKLALLRSKKEY